MRFTASTVTATSMPREPPERRHEIHCKDRHLIRGPQLALSAALRPFTILAPVQVHNAVLLVEEVSSISPVMLRSMRPLPLCLVSVGIHIGALSAGIIESSLPAMDGSDI